jgi:hypothetical protein
VAIWSNTNTDLNSGVPSIFLNSVVAVYGTIFSNAIAPGASISQNIGKYATLSLIGDSNPAAITCVQMDIHEAPIGGSFDQIITTEFLTSADPNIGFNISVPVIGSSVTFTNRGSQPLQLWIYGSNRITNASENVSDTFTPRQFQVTAAFTSGVAKPFLPIDGGNSCTSFNRVAWYSFGCGTIAGILEMQYVNHNGALDTFIVAASTASQTVTGVTAVPLGNVNWIVSPGGTASTQANLRLMQNILA